MQCMKCGRDLENEQVFCDACLEVMEQYPVKPGVVVQLPHRPQQPQQKKQPRKKVISPEEQVTLLRRLSRILATAVVLLLVAAVGLGWLSVKFYLDGEKKVLPGQNYFTATTPTTEAAETTQPPETTLPEYGVAG